MLILAVILGLGLQNQPFFVKTYHKLVGIFVTIIKYGNKLLENKKCDPSFFLAATAVISDLLSGED